MARSFVEELHSPEAVAVLLEHARRNPGMCVIRTEENPYKREVIVTLELAFSREALFDLISGRGRKLMGEKRPIEGPSIVHPSDLERAYRERRLATWRDDHRVLGVDHGTDEGSFVAIVDDQLKIFDEAAEPEEDDEKELKESEEADDEAELKKGLGK